jgi:hypothetical protein
VHGVFSVVQLSAGSEVSLMVLYTNNRRFLESLRLVGECFDVRAQDPFHWLRLRTVDTDVNVTTRFVRRIA